MKALRISLGVVVLIVVVVVIAAPIGQMPGIFIGGDPAPVPDVWGETKDIHEIRLQTGEGPIARTVTIWVVKLDGDLYVVGTKGTGWVSAIGDGGPVRMHLEESLYELQATPVQTDPQRVVTAWVDKYKTDYPEIVSGFPRPEGAAQTTAVFKLTRRS